MSELIESQDGNHAYNPRNKWIYYRHVSGQWVTLREATPDEIHNVETVQASNEALRIMFELEGVTG